jgi:hypothetical protein
MASFFVRHRSKFFPISRGSKSIEIQEGMAIQHGVRNANNALQTEQSLFVEFVSAQQVGVIAEISQKPAQSPECFGCAVNPASEGMAAVFLGFNDRESHEIKRSGRVPSIEGSFDSNQEDTFKGICAISAFVMQAGDVACHELTSCGAA